MKEMRNVQIVNENDEVIGHKKRAEIDYENDIYRNTALWVTNSSGAVLIAQRAFTKDTNPGKWGPAVAGTMEEGETYEANMYKEAEEELGITGVTFTVREKLRRHAPRKYFTQWYSVTLDRPLSEFRLQEGEVERIAWVPVSELARDIEAHPDKYVSSMPSVIRRFMGPEPV